MTEKREFNKSPISWMPNAFMIIGLLMLLLNIWSMSIFMMIAPVVLTIVGGYVARAEIMNRKDLIIRNMETDRHREIEEDQEYLSSWGKLYMKLYVFVAWIVLMVYTYGVLKVHLEILK